VTRDDRPSGDGRGPLGRTRDRIIARATDLGAGTGLARGLDLPGVGDADGTDCACSVSFETPPGARDRDRTVLRVDASDCPGEGDLATEPACRATVVDALTERDAAAVLVRVDGLVAAYEDAAAGLLLAAGRFVERAAIHEPAVADRARRDPLSAAREAVGRAGAIADVAAETGLAEGAARLDGYADLRPFVGPTVARSRVRRRPPEGGRLVDRRTLPTGATVRRYDAPERPHYHLGPPVHDLGAEATATLAAAADRLGAGAVEGGQRAPGRAVRQVADDDDPVETLTTVLRRYTRGNGVLEHLFADPQVSDVFASAPAAATSVRVAVDDERLPTNVRLTPGGAAAMASRLRRTSGRPLSAADPTLDATLEPEAADGEVRVAGVTAPASDGYGFAFRSHDGEPWTLPALVENGTLPPRAAALLSVAVERGAAVLVAGPRGAGKTTTLGALLFELPPGTRTVVVEDTPELPIDAVREVGRDVQPLRSDPGEGPEPTPTEAVRTALRLGKGALVVGEVRGEEARALYEAMRVGAGESAVLGTVHGEDAGSVRERVVEDLGVPVSSFATTDLVVSLAAENRRRLDAATEVRRAGAGVSFAPLFDVDAVRFESDGTERGTGGSRDPGDGDRRQARTAIDPSDIRGGGPASPEQRTGHGDPDRDRAVPTGVVARGNSRLVDDLRRPNESYADVRAALDERASLLASLAATGRTAPDEVLAAYRSRRWTRSSGSGGTRGDATDCTDTPDPVARGDTPDPTGHDGPGGSAGGPDPAGSTDLDGFVSDGR
jgi:type IV secretory pathway ATPase VirB11/archaellum biosynthesis ATPase